MSQVPLEEPSLAVQRKTALTSPLGGMELSEKVVAAELGLSAAMFTSPLTLAQL